MPLIAIFLALIFFHSLASRRLERTVLTPPILFTTAGMAVALVLAELQPQQSHLEVFLWVAELGLTLLLFTEASRTSLRGWQSLCRLPSRLLSTGLLLTILLGALGALAIFPQLSLWEAGILGAILAPTDAGLGQVIVNSPRVPLRIRQALNVEAGLNDGLSVPFLLFFIALASPAGPSREADLTRFIVQQLGFGTLVGLAIGLAGGWLLGWARRREWIAESAQQLAVVALPLLCAVACEKFEASMFIAAFVAGLAVQAGFKEAGQHSVEFAEEWGQLINLSVFFLFGVMVARTWGQFQLAHLLYAILSLTVVRMLPVALALLGTRLNRATVLFIGWFGPRGLASVVLGLVYLEQELHHPGETTIRLAIKATVFLSIFAHGLSALPGMSWYAARMAVLPATAPEFQTAGEPESKA